MCSGIEKLKEMNSEKDDLIKVLGEKFSTLQNWAQEMFSSICKKINENDQHHFRNEKILEQRISDLNMKLSEDTKK